MDPVINLADVQAISAGDCHSMALTRDGKVFAWGRNHAGQLGDGTSEDRTTPVAVPDLEDVVFISAVVTSRRDGDSILKILENYWS